MEPSEPVARRLADRRVLVVGASAGIGRATAIALDSVGAHVAAMARRTDRLSELGPDIEPLGGDVQVEDDCARAVTLAAAALGGLDAVVYATAVTHLSPIAATDPDDWGRIFSTNALGLTRILTHALPHLRDGWGRVLVLTSDSVGHPFPGLAAYVASKAAMQSIAASWAVEHPELSVITVVAGPTATEAASSWDPALVGSYFDRWLAEGYVRPDLVPAEPDEVAVQLLEVLGADRPPVLVDLAPPRPWLDRAPDPVR